MKKSLLPLMILTVLIFLSCDNVPVYEEVSVEDAFIAYGLFEGISAGSGVVITEVGNDISYVLDNYDLTQFNAEPGYEDYISLSGTISYTDSTSMIVENLVFTGGPVFTLEAKCDESTNIAEIFIVNGYDMKVAMNEYRALP